MRYDRQEGIISSDRLSKLSISMVGAGAVGSFTALALSKMGVGRIKVFDGDGVTKHNLPNQFYRKEDLNKFKVDALEEIISSFSDTSVKTSKKWYKDQKLDETVIVCTDSLSSRAVVWQEFLKQGRCRHFIDGRMGGELAKVYFVDKRKRADIRKYEPTLLETPAILPCSERSIIYCVMMISSIICRTVKGIAMHEKLFPRQTVFSMTHMIFEADHL